MSEAYRALTDRLNSWVGLEHTFSPAEIACLVWAMGVDGGLRADLNREAARLREEHVAEATSVHGR